MKKVVLLKSLVVIVPVLVGIYAHFYQTKKQAKVEAHYKGITQQELFSQSVATFPRN